MVDVAVVPVEDWHIAALVADMRQADIDEVTAATGGDLGQIVRDSVAASVGPRTALIDGEVACIFGVAPLAGLLGDVGAPWMLGTTVLDRHPGALMRRCRGYVAEMAARYPRLVNFVDVRNTRSVRWLKRLGFVFHPAAPYGAAGLPFHRFEMGDWTHV